MCSGLCLCQGCWEGRGLGLVVVRGGSSGWCLGTVPGLAASGAGEVPHVRRSGSASLENEPCDRGTRVILIV